MLVAESAVLHHFDSVRVVLLVLLRNIVSALAFCASKCDLYAHQSAPPKIDFFRCVNDTVQMASGRKFASLLELRRSENCVRIRTEAQKARFLWHNKNTSAKR